MISKPRVSYSFHFCVYMLCSTVFLPEINANVRPPPSPDTTLIFFFFFFFFWRQDENAATGFHEDQVNSVPEAVTLTNDPYSLEFSCGHRRGKLPIAAVAVTAPGLYISTVCPICTMLRCIALTN